MPTPPPDTGPPTRGVGTAAASNATATPGSGAPTRRLGLALAVIATAQLMVVLDGTIVNVALPHIQNAQAASRCCMTRARSRGGRRSLACSHPRVRSLASRSRPGCTTARDAGPAPTTPPSGWRRGCWPRMPMPSGPRRPQITFLQSRGWDGEQSSPDPGDSPTCLPDRDPYDGSGYL
jgi:hypothetical protein